MNHRSFHQRRHVPGQMSPRMGAFGLQVILQSDDGLEADLTPIDLMTC